jgi:hypothetical protein
MASIFLAGPFLAFQVPSIYGVSHPVKLGGCRNPVPEGRGRANYPQPE